MTQLSEGREMGGRDGKIIVLFEIERETCGNGPTIYIYIPSVRGPVGARVFMRAPSKYNYANVRVAVEPNEFEFFFHSVSIRTLDYTALLRSKHYVNCTTSVRLSVPTRVRILFR